MSLPQMSVAGALMILSALAVRQFLGNRLPRWTMPVVWACILLRLLIPAELPSPVSIYALLPAPEAVSVSAPADASALRTLSVEWLTRETALRTAKPLPVLPVLWVLGTTACATALAYLRLTSLHRYRESLPVREEAVSRWLARHPLRRTIQVRETDCVASPLTYGLFRPVILLPARRDWTEAELDCILTHEYVHIRHLDSLTKPLLLLCACIHWFNPLVWLMTVLAGRDLELWCDDGAVRLLGREQREHYALTLIRMEENRLRVPSCSSYFTTNPIKERIESIMKQKKSSVLATAFALLLVLTVTAIFATSASAEQALPSVKSGPFQRTGDASVTTEEGDGNATISSDEAQSFLDRYGVYGLTYDSSLQRFRYNGKLVRYFEDMYPINADGSEKAGTVIQMDNGEVDVYSIRDYSNLKQNADGSYDPSGELTGLREATQEEFDTVTALLEENRLYADKGMSYAGEASSVEADDFALDEGGTADQATTETDVILAEDYADKISQAQETADWYAEAYEETIAQDILAP